MYRAWYHTCTTSAMHLLISAGWIAWIQFTRDFCHTRNETPTNIHLN